MKLIIGLGNIGKEYDKTRHNIGFMIVDKLSEDLNVNFSTNSKLEAEIAKGNGIVLVKPTTYMNLSGRAVRKVFDFYKSTVEEIIVIYDDKDLEPGVLRLRAKGSAGGQNGMKDIIKTIGTENIKRIRFGIGKPSPTQDLSTYVLSHFSKSEQQTINDSIAKVCYCLREFINDKDFVQLMSDYNG